MIIIKSNSDLEKMRKAGALLHQVHEYVKSLVKPGVTTAFLDREAERMIRDLGAVPSCKGYNDYPYALCTSVNDCVVHGFPNDTPLQEGDLLSVDTCLMYDGWQTDSAWSTVVGEGSEETKRLIRVTEECFWLAADQCREGKRLGDIGHAVQSHAEKNGYGVIREMCGHGIGRDMHEDPSVPNYGTAGRGVRLKAGMVLAVEPMISAGGWPIYIEKDGWTAKTRDHSWCSHYEHTIAITKGEPELLTLPGAKLRRPV